MDANKIELNSFLSQKQQLSIPIYQRKYSWGERELKQLWEDVIKTGEDESIKNHFIGTIVYMNLKPTIPSPISELLLIDGQQRMTTISLLIAALTSFVRENETDIDYHVLLDYFLINNNEKGDKKYKLVLSGKDNETLSKIIDSLSSDDKLIFEDDDAVKIIASFEYFKNKINSNNYLSIYQGFLKLMIIEIGLERGIDNPQLIFESLNSTGLELNKSDLIRNYILMGMDVDIQNEIYEKYWSKLENEFAKIDENDIFDAFIRDYLTIKNNGVIPTFKNIYSDFKKYAENFEDKMDLVKDVYKYAQYYFKFILLYENDVKLREAFESLNELKYGVTNNFILRVYVDYQNEVIDSKTFVEIVELVESYLTRRKICDIPTVSLNKTFSTLYNEIDKRNYLESLQVALISKESYRRFPNDEEFIGNLITRDLYTSQIRNYFLKKLENYDSKELINIDAFTIEHIMPQNPKLSNEWMEMLGENWQEIHDKYLHTLGNLTLTAYNSELSDKPFIEKRDIKGGFAESPSTLNGYLGKLEKWDEEEILKRADELSKLACEIWQYPEVSDETIAGYKVEDDKKESKYTLESYEFLADGSPMHDLYDDLSKQILAIDDVIKMHYRKYYISFKTRKTFVNIVPQSLALELRLYLPFEELDDSKGLCRDITNIEKSGNVEFKLKSKDDLDYAMDLIKQSYAHINRA